MKMQQPARNYQTGATTLIITVLILLIISLMVFFATRVGIMDQRMAGNEARYKEAFATAEAGLELAIERFVNQFQSGYTGSESWTNIITNSTIASGTETDGTSAESGEPSFGVTINDTGASLSGIPVYEFVSTAVGADGTGTATIRRQVVMKKILGGSAFFVPIIYQGPVQTRSNLSIVANPNGGGSGVPISIWTGKTGANIEMTSSSASCQREYYVGNNPQCSTGELLSQGDGTILTSYNSTFPDVIPNDSNFPADLFRFVFGVEQKDWETVKAMAATYNHVVSDCSGLGDTSGQTFRLWWVTGDCNMGSSQIIGSMTDPVILVIDDHGLSMTGGAARIHGITYLFNNPSNAAIPGADLTGNAALYGAIVADMGGTFNQHGSFSIVYDSSLVDNLIDNDSANFTFAYIPGSWRDF